MFLSVPCHVQGTYPIFRHTQKSYQVGSCYTVSHEYPIKPNFYPMKTILYVATDWLILCLSIYIYDTHLGIILRIPLVDVPLSGALWRSAPGWLVCDAAVPRGSTSSTVSTFTTLLLASSPVEIFWSMARNKKGRHYDKPFDPPSTSVHFYRFLGAFGLGIYKIHTWNTLKYIQ